MNSLEVRYQTSHGEERAFRLNVAPMQGVSVRAAERLLDDAKEQILKDLWEEGYLVE